MDWKYVERFIEYLTSDSNTKVDIAVNMAVIKGFEATFRMLEANTTEIGVELRRFIDDRA